MRVLGLPIESPQAVVNRIASDVGAIARLARRALEMATPLEGTIDRIGRLVDRLPGRLPRTRPPRPGEGPPAPPAGP